MNDRRDIPRSWFWFCIGILIGLVWGLVRSEGPPTWKHILMFAVLCIAAVVLYSIRPAVERDPLLLRIFLPVGIAVGLLFGLGFTYPRQINTWDLFIVAILCIFGYRMRVRERSRLHKEHPYDNM